MIIFVDEDECPILGLLIVFKHPFSVKWKEISVKAQVEMVGLVVKAAVYSAASFCIKIVKHYCQLLSLQ